MKTWRPRRGNAGTLQRWEWGLGGPMMLETGGLFGGDMLRLNLRMRDQETDSRLLSMLQGVLPTLLGKAHIPRQVTVVCPLEDANNQEKKLSCSICSKLSPACCTLGSLPTGFLLLVCNHHNRSGSRDPTWTWDLLGSLLPSPVPRTL